jgi:hypothetical protein
VCKECERLKNDHIKALLEWTRLGGTDPLKSGNPDVKGASDKVTTAVQAILDHRRTRHSTPESVDPETKS